MPEQGDIIANAGFPGKTAELLASGKAILATKFSDLPLYLTNGVNAMISEIGDHITYAQNLEKLIVDKMQRDSIGAHARETALKMFSAKNAINLYVE